MYLAFVLLFNPGCVTHFYCCAGCSKWRDENPYILLTTISRKGAKEYNAKMQRR